MSWYIKQMEHELQAHARCEENGIDQGVHNYLIYRPEAKDSGHKFFFHTNRDGPVFTGGYFDKSQIDSWWCPESVVNSANGEIRQLCRSDHKTPYVVLHQYDRHLSTLLPLADQYVKTSGNYN